MLTTGYNVAAPAARETPNNLLLMKIITITD
jgi:hypothetical protein